MVTRPQTPDFVREESGASLIEGLIVFPLVLLAITTFFEFGYAVFQWNQTVKALQLGARLLAVSNPVIDEDAAQNMDDLTADYTSGGGAAVPATILSVSCGAGETACETTEIERLVYGSDNKCKAASGLSMPGMCDVNDRIRPEHVRVTYYRAGLGYQGRPDGPVLTITVEVPDFRFDLPLVGALLGLGKIRMPLQPVTMTSEDLCSQKSC